MRTLLAGTVVVVALLNAGCQAPPAPTARTETVLDVADYEAFIDHTLSVLRSYHFEPSFVDWERGVVLTRRSTGAQWNEPWRREVLGDYQKLESNLHTIGRVARVNVEPVNGGLTESPIREVGASAPSASGPYRVSVEVEKARYQVPTRQVTSVTSALGIFSERLPTEDGLRGIAARRQVHWRPLGRDGLLEQALLTELAATRVATNTVAAPSAGG
jgi:hypothetical protein